MKTEVEECDPTGSNEARILRRWRTELTIPVIVLFSVGGPTIALDWKWLWLILMPFGGILASMKLYFSALGIRASSRISARLSGSLRPEEFLGLVERRRKLATDLVFLGGNFLALLGSAFGVLFLLKASVALWVIALVLFLAGVAIGLAVAARVTLPGSRNWAGRDR